MPKWFDFFAAQLMQLDQRPNEMLQLEWQDFQQFQCSGCGACCSTPWRIFLDQVYHEKWYVYFDQHPTGRFADPFLLLDKPSPEQYAQMRKQADTNRCVFLEPDNACFIHRHYGHEALPALCQSYPRAQFAKPKHQYQLRVLSGTCPDVPLLWQQTAVLNVTWIKAPPETTQTPALTASLLLWLGITLDSLLQAPPVVALYHLGVSLDTLFNHPSEKWGSLLPLLYREHMRRLDDIELKFDILMMQQARHWAAQLLQQWQFSIPEPLHSDTFPDEWPFLLRQYLLRRSCLLPHMVSDWPQVYGEYLMQVIYGVMLRLLMGFQYQQTPQPNPFECFQWAVKQLEQKIFHRHAHWVKNQGIDRLSPQTCLAWAYGWLGLLQAQQKPLQ